MHHGHCYAPELADALRRAPAKVQSVLELGVCAGNSLGMWAEFFSNADVVGIDLDGAALHRAWPEITERLGPGRSQQVHFLAANYSDAAALEIVTQRGPFDLVIDDGSHDEETMLEAFYLLFFSASGLKPGGLYVIFDVHQALQEGGLSGFKRLVDRVNFNGVQIRGYEQLNSHLRVVLDPHEAWIEAIEFRRNVIVVRKRQADPF